MSDKQKKRMSEKKCRKESCSPDLKATVSYFNRLSVLPYLYMCLSTVYIPFISRTTGIISIKLGTKDHWLIGIKVYSNERSRSLRRIITDTKYKCMDKIKDLLLNHWAKLGTKHPLVKDIKVSSNKRQFPLSRGDGSENTFTTFKNLPAV